MADMDAAAIVTRLNDLQTESERRTAELREIAAQLPAVVGRRAMIRTLIGDTARNPHKRTLLKRGFERVNRAARDAARRLQHQLRRSAS